MTFSKNVKSLYFLLLSGPLNLNNIIIVNNNNNESIYIALFQSMTYFYIFHFSIYISKQKIVTSGLKTNTKHSCLKVPFAKKMPLMLKKWPAAWEQEIPMTKKSGKLPFKSRKFQIFQQFLFSYLESSQRKYIASINVSWFLWTVWQLFKIKTCGFQYWKGICITTYMSKIHYPSITAHFIVPGYVESSDFGECTHIHWIALLPSLFFTVTSLEIER